MRFTNRFRIGPLQNDVLSSELMDDRLGIEAEVSVADIFDGPNLGCVGDYDCAEDCEFDDDDSCDW